MVSVVAGRIDQGIAELAEAAELTPGDASLWSDLAAAHLQRGVDASDPFETVLAFAAADRAAALDPSSLPARFNRALASERLSLERAAAADWRKVAAEDGDPDWSREAQSHVDRLKPRSARKDWNLSLASFEGAVRRGDLKEAEAIARRSPQRFREHVMGSVLPAWARQSGPEAAWSLAIARAVGEAFAAEGGDPMLAETVAQIEDFRRSNPEGLVRLREAFLAYGNGEALLQQESFSQAAANYGAAVALLSRLGSPFAGWADFQAAYCQNRQFELARARSLLVDLESNPGIVRFKALRGRVLWVLALLDAVEGDLTESQARLEASVAEFQALRERDNVARLRAFMAVNSDYLGRPADAWRRLHPALHDWQALESPQAQRVVVQAAASLAYEQGELGVAAAFIEELVRLTRADGQTSARVEALRWHAVILSRLGRREAAAAALSEGRLIIRQTADPGARRSLEGDLLLAEGELALAEAPERAVAALGPAIEIFRAHGYHYQLGHALYLRARAEERMGRFDAEERDLTEAISELEQQRERLLAAEQRISYLDRRREILDAMISLQLRRRHPAEALRFSEAAKARVLWDWILTQPERPRSLQARRASAPDLGERSFKEIPEGTAIVEYAVLPRTTVLWLVRRGAEAKVATIGLGASKVEALVKALHEAIDEGETAFVERAAEDLYDAVLRPIARDLLDGERLVFVPDGGLHGLPFALLRDSRSKRYLIQDHTCSIAPSIRLFLAGLERDRALDRGREPRSLVVADPAFDQIAYPTLRRLPAAEAEESAVQSFPGSVVMRDQKATRQVFLESAGGFEIVHFGGHSVINTEFPLLSQMLFAKEPDPSKGGGGGVLYSGDILHRTFPRTRLVVLASCSTGLGRISRTEGVENLARPFLASGVPVVLASWWKVKNEATEDLFARFYRHLRLDFDAAAALRAAKLEALEQGGVSSDPALWGAFEVIGGSGGSVVRRQGR